VSAKVICCVDFGLVIHKIYAVSFPKGNIVVDQVFTEHIGVIGSQRFVLSHGLKCELHCDVSVSDEILQDCYSINFCSTFSI